MKTTNRSLWTPSDRDEPARVVEVLAIVYHRDRIDGALIREIGKPLRGMAIVPLYELEKVRGE